MNSGVRSTLKRNGAASDFSISKDRRHVKIELLFSAHEGKYEEALDAALALTACSRKDEGNVAYDTFESATNPDVFMICETWENEEVLKKHMEAEHFKLYVGQLEQLGTLKLEQFDFPKK